MLLSMTGYGEARGQAGALGYAFEVRSVNNRHLKLTLRAPEPYALLEAEFEKVVRQFVRRGTVLVQLRVERQSRPDDFRINAVAVRSYVEQMHQACAAMDAKIRPNVNELLGQVLALPGVVHEHAAGDADVSAEWPTLSAGLTDALTQLQRMRRDEGGRMAGELRQFREQIAEYLAEIRKLEPNVVTAYRDRLLERVKALMADGPASIAADDLTREVTIFAERSDVAEEIVRLESHLIQFEEILLGGDESAGRKLEFVVQEIGREANTLGSKAGDVAISRLVVEIKTVLEKVREIILNIE